MNNIYFIGSFFFFLLIGIISYTYINEIIIIRTPYVQPLSLIKEEVAKKKVVKCFYWNNEKWHNENNELIWGANIARNISYLLNSWLNLVDEEEVMNKKVTVQSVALSDPSQTVYISFDRNPFDKEGSAYKKLMLIEGILKTLRENGISVTEVQFLVHHNPIEDYHLDFSNPWPIIGFVN